tara:strand:- start:150 stop:341 length:192 start_codon:yes stop_codon:yes gene_type:complete
MRNGQLINLLRRFPKRAQIRIVVNEQNIEYGDQAQQIAVESVFPTNLLAIRVCSVGVKHDGNT